MKELIKCIFKKFGYNVSRITNNKNEDNIVGSRKTNLLTYYNTKTGNYYLPTDACNDIIANTIKRDSVFEPEIVEIANKYIKKDTAVLDIGANFGQMSILFSEKVGCEGIVYSFDADDHVFEILKKNIGANDKQKVIIPIFGAVHNKNNETLFFPEPDFKEFGSYGSFGIDYVSRKGRKVNSLTIDSLQITKPISFMKIDVQGGDLLVMKGAINTIKENKMPIIFEYEYHFEEKFDLKFQEYVDFVSSIGYKFEKVIYGHNYLIIPT